jgi:ABC-type multidrug transport system permease subunit
MIKILELIKKDFKLLVRAKVSALIIFIGPLLLVSLLGLAYSQSSTYTLTASTYSDSYTELTDSLVTKMTNQNFRVIKQESMDNCVGSVKRGEAQACVIFPGGMTIEDGKTNQITFYVDYSQINLVWLMLDVMSARVSERSVEISQDLTKDVLNRMWFVEEKMNTGKSLLSQAKSSAESVKGKASEARGGFQGLDINVDFTGLNIAESRALSVNTTLLLVDINSKMTNLSASVSRIVGRIENAASSIQSSSNESDIDADANDIDDAADDITNAMENASLAIDDDILNASEKIDSIKASFDRITQRLTETKLKMDTVKKKRDELLPQFDNISSDIDSLVSTIGLAQGTLDEALQKISSMKGRSAESIAAPITTKIEPITTQKTHFNSLFPTLLVLVMMITGILLSSTLIIVEKKSKAFLRNNLTPTSYITFNLSAYLTSLIVIFVQLILFVSVSAFFFETEVIASMWLLILIALLASTVFICIGMLIGFLFKTEETVTLAAITLATVFLLFSSAVIPLESLPAYLKQFALLNPFVISELAFRQAIIFQFGFMKVLGSILLLLGYSFIIFGVLTFLQYAFSKISFSKFAKLHVKIPVSEKKAAVELTKTEAPKKVDINELAVGK